MKIKLNRNNYGKKFLIILLILITIPSVSLEAKTIHLDFAQCVERALKHNDEIKAAYKDIDLSHAKKDEAHPRHIPILKYKFRTAPIPRDVDNAVQSLADFDLTIFANFNLEVFGPLTTFGKISTAQDLAQLGIDASWFQKQRKEDEVVFKIYQVYQGVLLAKELLTLADQARRGIGEKIDGLEKEKIKDQLQILKLKVALYEIERRVEEAKRREKLAWEALKVLTGIPDEVNVGIKSNALRPVGYHLQPLKHYLDQAESYLPEFQLLEIGIQALEKRLKLEKLNYTPNLGYGGFLDIGKAPGVIGDEDETEFSNPFNFTRAGIGIELRGEFDGVKTRAKIRQAEADLLKNIYNKRAAERGLKLKVKEAYFEVEETRNLLEKSGLEKKAAKQMLFLTKSNLDIGVGEKKDYLDALQSYLVFQGREFEAIFRYNVAVAKLRNQIGRLYRAQRKEKEYDQKS